MMKTTFRSAMLAAVAVAATLPAAAWAQPASPPAANPPAATGGQGGRGPGGGLFDEMDANKDARVTWDEAWALVQRRFAAADADRDGGLTRQEAEALRPARNPARQQPPAPADQAARRARFGDVIFRSLDANRDSRVTLDEMRPVIEARFRGLDADGDNAVARGELPQRREGSRQRGPDRGGSGNQGQGDQGQRNQGQGGQAPAAPR